MKPVSFVVSLIVVVCGLLAYCRAEVVLYTSVDATHARAIVKTFSDETGVAVKIVTDTEATKSVGLAERVRAEKNNPRCDVWWGNEPFHTVRLAEEGLFEPYQSPAAKDVRELFKDKQHRWAGNGIRARVIAFYSTLGQEPPATLDGLLDPALKGKILMGKPALGTIGGHVASIYATRGQEKADAFFKGLKDNGIVLVGGNGKVPQQIAAGNFVAGMTDNDDVAALAGKPVFAILPDQAEGQSGTLAIPTTVALIKRGDINPDSKKLIDYLLSEKVEKTLIDARFSAWSVRSPEGAFRAMPIDYAEVAKLMPTAVRRAEAILEGRTP